MCSRTGCTIWHVFCLPHIVVWLCVYMRKAKEALQVFYVYYILCLCLCYYYFSQIFLTKLFFPQKFLFCILCIFSPLSCAIYIKNTCLLYKISYLLCLRVNGHTVIHLLCVFFLSRWVLHATRFYLQFFTHFCISSSRYSVQILSCQH